MNRDAGVSPGSSEAELALQKAEEELALKDRQTNGQIEAVLADEIVRAAWKGVCSKDEAKRRELLVEFAASGKRDKLRLALTKKGYEALEANLEVIDNLHGRGKITLPPKAETSPSAVAEGGAPAARPEEGEGKITPEMALKIADKEYAADVDAYAKTDQKFNAAYHRTTVVELWSRARRSKLDPAEYGFFQRRTSDPAKFDDFAKQLDLDERARALLASTAGRKRYIDYPPGSLTEVETRLQDDIKRDLERQIETRVKTFAQRFNFLQA